jgi:hypothetical protein
LDTTILLWEILPASRPRTEKLTKHQLDALWNDLASEDATQAYRAVQTLTRAADQAIAYFAGRLTPVATADPKLVERLIGDLDSDEFEIRDKAVKQLEYLGDLAAPACRKALESELSAEARRRLEALLKKQKQRVWDPSQDELRLSRALEVLEMAGTSEAPQLLETLTKGAPEARLTREAKAALARLKRPQESP